MTEEIITKKKPAMKKTTEEMEMIDLIGFGLVPVDSLNKLLLKRHSPLSLDDLAVRYE